MSTPVGAPPTRPPGWYPDPARKHQYRYFDGLGWTATAADNGLEVEDPIPPVNGIAVSSLVLGIVGVLLIVLSFAMLRVSTLLFFGGLACCGLAVAFGASGVRRSPTRAGRGLAWAGLIVGAVMLVAVIALFAIAMLLFMSYMSE